MLRERLTDTLKTAMKEKQPRALSTIRMILAKLKERDIEARPKGNAAGVADAEARVLDAFAAAVLGHGVDDETGRDLPHRLVMGAVDRQLVRTGDAVEQRSWRHADRVAGLGARVRLLVCEGARDLVGNVLDE